MAWKIIGGRRQWVPDTQTTNSSTSTYNDGSYIPNAGDIAAQEGDYNAAYLYYQGLAGSTSNTPSTVPTSNNNNWWESTKNILGNSDLMTGIAGAGQLGLGLANYMAMKPVYEEQLKSMQQNREIAKANYDQRQRQAQEFSNAARPIG